MSENPNQEAINAEPELGKSSMNAAEQVPKTLMIYMDPVYNQYLLHPGFRAHFDGLLFVIEELRQIVNQKWTVEQQTAYLTFLNDFYNYIVGYVFTIQVHYWEDFLAWIEYIKTQYNPVGY